MKRGLVFAFVFILLTGLVFAQALNNLKEDNSNWFSKVINEFTGFFARTFGFD